MLFIIVISMLVAILLAAFLFIVIQTIRNKANDKPVKNKALLFALPLLLIIFSFYDGYLVLSYLNQNKEKILDAGQSAISNTVEFGATAVFEGVGQSWDHFEEKWEDDFVRKLKKVDVELKSIMSTIVDKEHNSVVVDVIYTNNNTAKDELSIDGIGRNNYILLDDENEVYYPVRIENKDNYNFLPSGKTMLQLTGVVPSDTKITSLRLLNQKYNVASIQ